MSVSDEELIKSELILALTFKTIHTISNFFFNQKSSLSTLIFVRIPIAKEFNSSFKFLPRLIAQKTSQNFKNKA